MDSITQIHIDSLYPDVNMSPTLNTSLRFNLKKTIEYNPRKYKAEMVLLEGYIPRSYYILNPNNDKFKIVYDGTTYDFTLPNGNYNILNVVSAMNTLVNASAIPTTFTCTYSRITNKMTLKFSNTNVPITIDFNYVGTAYIILGFSKDVHSFIADGVDMAL